MKIMFQWESSLYKCRSPGPTWFCCKTKEMFLFVPYVWCRCLCLLLLLCLSLLQDVMSYKVCPFETAHVDALSGLPDWLQRYTFNSNTHLWAYDHMEHCSIFPLHLHLALVFLFHASLVLISSALLQSCDIFRCFTLRRHQVHQCVQLETLYIHWFFYHAFDISFHEATCVKMCVRLIRRAMPRTFILLFTLQNVSKSKCHRSSFIPKTMHFIQFTIPCWGHDHWRCFRADDLLLSMSVYVQLLLNRQLVMHLWLLQSSS